MNDKEQLGEIKGRISKLFGYETAKDDAMYYMKKGHITWLIEQAEKVEQLQQEIEKLTRIAAEADEACEYWKDRYKQAQAKIERYRDVLEWYAHSETYKRAGNGEYVIMMDKGWNAKQVLKGETV